MEKNQDNKIDEIFNFIFLEIKASPYSISNTVYYSVDGVDLKSDNISFQALILSSSNWRELISSVYYPNTSLGMSEATVRFDEGLKETERYPHSLIEKAHKAKTAGVLDLIYHLAIEKKFRETYENEETDPEVCSEALGVDKEFFEWLCERNQLTKLEIYCEANENHDFEGYSRHDGYFYDWSDQCKYCGIKENNIFESSDSCLLWEGWAKAKGIDIE